jgi:hypothetical protein
MATTSLRKIEIKVISVISLCTLLWMLTPDAFAVSGKNKSIKTTTKTAGRTSQAPILNTFLNGLGAPNATDGIDGDFYLDTLSSNLYGPKKKGKWPLPKSLVGPVGPQGPVGKQGSEGKVGDKGVATSSAGSQGAQGAQGTQGAQGVPGTQGTPGAAGSSGPSGGAGVAGSVGATGAPGPQGSPGSAGAPGVIGATGSQGVAGTTGSTGARGPIGETGTVGADGPQGAAGIVTLIRGAVTSLALSTSSAGTGIDSSAVVQFKQNKKYEFSIKLIGTIAGAQLRKTFGMTVTATNSINLNYVVTTLEANTFRNGNSEHEYVFESSGTFECPSVPGLLSYSVLDAQGITGANPMSITGSYLLREVSTIFTVNQGSPVLSW